MEPELEQYNFGDDIVAFSTTRHGGVSKGNYAELNINPYCGDDPKDVSANLKTLCDALEITTDHLILPHQTHQTVCRAITPEYFDLSNEKRKEYLEGVDAVMTDMPKVCVGVSTADCIPLLYYDTEHKAIAAVHAGWRGTLAGIATKALEAMAKQYGTQPGKVRTVCQCLSLHPLHVEEIRQMASRPASLQPSATAPCRCKTGEHCHVEHLHL